MTVAFDDTDTMTAIAVGLRQNGIDARIKVCGFVGLGLDKPQPIA